ncbi:MAG: response regulator transcription factor [Desulfobacteraceae bacterium]|nr:response regulator transcription factor [Desulfobacteraceae bacterium]
MGGEQLLVVDDEEDILELVRYTLVREGYHVKCASSGEEALDRLRSEPVDLVVLDLMLPGIDGLEVARRLKQENGTRGIPVVMLTAKGEESDVVTGLELGADDYITKPFSPRILTARIRTVLRRHSRSQAAESNTLIFPDLQIYLHKHEVLVQGQPVSLTFTEFEVLTFLAKRPGWVFTRSQIVDAVRGDSYSVTDRSVDVQIVGLRKKLGPCGSYVETVRGVGYRFRE